MLAGRWWKNTSDQIPANGKTKHVVPKLSRRVFKVFVYLVTQAFSFVLRSTFREL